MQWFEKTFFEDPFYVYVVLALAGVVCLGMWRARRQFQWLAAIAVLGLLAAGAHLLDRAVMTDREQIRAALDAMADAATRRDAAALTDHLDDSYRGWGLRKAAVRVAAEVALRRYSIRAVKHTAAPQIKVTGDRADSRVYIVIHHGGEGSLGRYPMGWQVEWIRRGDRWKVQHATQLDNPLP